MLWLKINYLKNSKVVKNKISSTSIIYIVMFSYTLEEQNETIQEFLDVNETIDMTREMKNRCRLTLWLEFWFCWYSILKKCIATNSDWTNKRFNCLTIIFVIMNVVS